MDKSGSQLGQRLTPIVMIALLNMAGACYYAYFFLSEGYLPSPFVWAKSETFMDLFHTLHWAYDDGRYTEWKSVYPPLNFDVLRLLNFVFGGLAIGPAPLMRASSPYLVGGFCMVYLAVPALILRTEYWRAQGLGQKAGIYVAILLSAPMLFALERGNLILLCPILLAVTISRGGFARALCISLLVNLKPYFVLLCILYVARKDWKGLAQSVSLSGGIFLLSGLLLDSNFLLFFRNLFGFAQSGNLFSLMEVLALPSSISAFSYALRLPHAHDIGHPALVVFAVFFIEAVKWAGIAACVLALLVKRRVMRDGEILALLVAITTNAGVFAGGYSLIYYAAIIPVFLAMKDRRVYIGLLVVMAMPLDFIPLLSRFAGEQHSFLSDSDVRVQWTLGLGSVVRPIANLVLMLLLSREIMARESEASALLAAASRLVAWTRRHCPRVPARLYVFVGLGGTLFAAFIYNGLYFNRYLPLTEGWFSAYGHLIGQGLVPYRDFYLFITPLYPLLVAAVQMVFGDSFIVLRIVGIVLILLLSLLLYMILSRRFSPFVSLVSTATAVVYYQSGVAHIAYDFIQLFTVFVLAAIYLILRYTDQRSRREDVQSRTVVSSLFFAGFMVALAFLTKQSNGTLVAVLSVPAVMVACSGQASRIQAARDMAFYLLGMALPLLGCGIWLFIVDALVPFMDQAAFGAIESKGSIGGILLFWIWGLLTKEYLIALRNAMLFICPIVAIGLLDRVVANRWPNLSQFRLGEIQKIFLFLMFFTVVLALSYIGRVNIVPWTMEPGVWLYAVVVAASTLFVFVLATALPLASLGTKSLRGFAVRNIDLTVIAIMALGLVAGNGTSAGISEVSVFLGFALGLGLLLSLPDSYGASRILVSALSLSFILFLTNAKFRQPYAWWYVSEPDVQLSTTKPSLPLLAGFRLSPSAAKVFEDATEAIQSHSKRGDDVFVFPHIPGLYLLSGRWPHSKVVVSWFDFLPDPLAKAEADRLLAAPPTVIVNLKIPDAAWEAHERLFREGRPLGQRAIRAAIDGLTKEGSFQLDISREVSPGCILEVWHRIAAPQLRGESATGGNPANRILVRE